MIGTFVRLKLRLVVNGARSAQQIVGMVVGVVFGFVLGVGMFAVLTFAGRGGDDADLAGEVAVVVTGSVFFGWVLASVFLFGVDESVDVRRLALLPLTRRQLHTGLAVAALVGIGPIATAVGLSGLVAGYAPPAPGAVLVVVAAGLAVVMPMLASRALATFLAGRLRSRWTKDLAVLVGAVLPMGGYFLPTVLGNTSSFGTAADLLRFTPGGLPGLAVAAVHRGDLPVALGALAASVAWTAVFWWVWIVTVGRLLVEPEPGAVGRAGRGGGRARAALGWPRPSPAGAVRLRELRYLVRAPNRRTILLTGPVLIVFIVVSQLAVSDATTGAYGAGVALVFVATTQLCNQFGYHSGALWLEETAAASARDLIVGRHAAWAVTAALPAFVVAVVLGAVGTGWTLALLLLCAYLASLPVLLGVGSVASVLAAFPVAEDANPFRNQTTAGQGCLAGLAATAVVAASLLVLAPPVALVGWAAGVSELLGFVALVPLAAYSWGARHLTVLLATTIFTSRRDHLLESLSLTRTH